MATVRITPEAREQLRALPDAIKARIHDLSERLKSWPMVSGVKPLRGRLKGHFRLRTGDYRLQFRIEGATVFIEKVGHRDRFYGRE